MQITIRVDTGAADYINIKWDLDKADIPNIELMLKAIKGYEPYIGITNTGLKWVHKNNFPNGFGYGYTMHRSHLGEKSPYEFYVESGMVTESIFNTFKKYVKKRRFHTIHEVKIGKRVVFKIDNYKVHALERILQRSINGK